MSASFLTVRDLRRQWKPHKERLSGHPTAIRFHRACSWLDRAEKLDGVADADLVLINQWIALNALYGQWNPQQREPFPDRESWRDFFDRLLKLDGNGRISGLLQEHKPLILTILEDEYLAGFFWKDPTDQNKQVARNLRKKALSWFVGKEWTRILDQVLDRIYLQRCQLIHGAATFGGKLNRATLRRTTQMLGHLLPAVLQVLIDYGADADWGALCYPPMQANPDARNGVKYRPGLPR